MCIRDSPWVVDGISDKEFDVLQRLLYLSEGAWEFIGPPEIRQWGSDSAEGAFEALFQLDASAYYALNPDAALALLRDGGPEPVVRVIYATPSDVEVNPTYMGALEDAYHSIQDWFAGKLDGLTFHVQSPVAQHCTLPNPHDYYAREGGYGRVIEDLQHCEPVSYRSPYFVWAIYVDTPLDCEASELGAGWDGITIMHRGDLRGLSNPEGAYQCGFPRTQRGYIGGSAHELSHAFGVPHPPGCDEGLDTCDWYALTSGGYVNYPDTYFTTSGLEILMGSPFIRIRKD